MFGTIIKAKNKLFNVTYILDKEGLKIEVYLLVLTFI